MFREVFVMKDNLTIDTRLHEELKKTKNPVVLYCHGEKYVFEIFAKVWRDFEKCMIKLGQINVSSN